MKNTITATQMTPGIIDIQKTVRYPPGPQASTRNAMAGPTTAPNWSIARWKPNERPSWLFVARVGHDGVARRRPHSLAEPVDEAATQHHPPPAGQRQQRAG